MPTRPRGFAFLAIFLATQALAGLLVALERCAPSLARGSTPTPTWLVLAGLAYGLTASLAAVAVWRVRRWAPAAFVAWSLAAVLILAQVSLAVGALRRMDAGDPTGTWWVLPAALVAAALAVLAATARWLARRVRTSRGGEGES